MIDFLMIFLSQNNPGLGHELCWDIASVIWGFYPNVIISLLCPECEVELCMGHMRDKVFVAGTRWEREDNRKHYFLLALEKWSPSLLHPSL